MNVFLEFVYFSPPQAIFFGISHLKNQFHVDFGTKTDSIFENVSQISRNLGGNFPHCQNLGGNFRLYTRKKNTVALITQKDPTDVRLQSPFTFYYERLRTLFDHDDCDRYFQSWVFRLECVFLPF